MTVRQMARLVHPSSAAGRVLAVLEAYFDESGLHSPVAFAMAGYVGGEREWRRFEKRWDALLQNPLRYPNPDLSASRAAKVGAPLKYLHATEMEGLGSGRFRQLGQKNRDYLKAASVNIVLSSGLVGIAAAVVLPDYELLDENVKSQIHDPYLLCFQFIVTQVAKKAKIFFGDDSENIAYVFEQQPVWQAKATHLWNSAVEQGYKSKYRMGSVAFGDKRDFSPLQAADRQAFETFKHFEAPSVPREIWHRLGRARYTAVSSSTRKDSSGSLTK